MIYDPMPTVHVYPHDMFEMTGHETEGDHECWCEPRVVIVPPDHRFAKERNTTRVFYHTELPYKNDWKRDASKAEVKAAPSIKRFLRSIPEPPAGGWGPIELREGIVDLIDDVTKNGWELPPPVEKESPQVTLFRSLLESLVESKRYTGEIVVFPQEHMFLGNGTFICADCRKRVEDCKCDDIDDDNNHYAFK